MPDLAAAYADTHASMARVTTDLSDEHLATRVPACPDWTVKDLIAHVTSIAGSISSDAFPSELNPALFWDEDMASRRDTFVDQALALRRDLPIDAILDEWSAAAEPLVSMIRGERPWPAAAPPLPEWIVTTDLAVHHHDLRGAVGQPGERDSLATGLSLRSYVEGMRFRTTAEGLPTMKIRAGTREWVIGDGEPVATVTADPFEIARAASGRRSPEQIEAFDWEGDPRPFLVLFYPYGLRTEALVE